MTDREKLKSILQKSLFSYMSDGDGVTAIEKYIELVSTDEVFKPKWEDLRFPLVGNRIDVSGGRIDYNYFNGSVGFQLNSRFPNEPVSVVVQLPHSWEQGSLLKPHFHWLQQSSNQPNWILAYKKYKNGESAILETNFNNHIKVKVESNAFEYDSEVLVQISSFPDIDMSDMKISDFLHCVLFRDSLNNSGLFEGVDPSSLTEQIVEFDIHYKIDSLGSGQVYIK